MSANDEIANCLKTYEKSLNTFDAALAATCYASDGMFIPTTLPTASGTAMEEASVRRFEAIRLNVTFAIDEMVVASEEIAFALMRSNGTQTIVATDDRSVESSREMFVFRRELDSWKIWRDMFNKPQ